MKIPKRIVLFLLAVLLVLPSGYAFAENEEAVYSAEALAEYNETVEFISDLEIYSFSDKLPEETVTRAMFARMVSDLLGINADYSSSDSFSDVSQTNEYSASISAMASLGIMNGVGNGKFLPDEPITYTQAIKTVVTALGYEPAASVGGGYSDGYLHSAKLLGLMKNPPYDYDAPLTFEAAVRIIDAALEVDVFEILYYTENTVSYASREGRTVLSVYHNIFSDEGIMTDNGITAINSETSVASDCLKIGERVLTVKDEKKRDFLGYYVEYYYREDDNALLYVSEKQGRNETVTIQADELLPDDTQFSKTCLVAEVDGKKKKYKIDLYANLVYNGGVDMTFGRETLKIGDGFIKLIDADADGDYETVIAEEYSDIIFKNCNADNKKITALHSAEEYAYIDYNDYRCVAFLNADGTETVPENIKEGSVVSVFRSKNKEKIKFIVSEITAEITADSVETDADGRISIIFGDTYYEFSSTGEALMNSKPNVYKKPEASSSYMAYLNYEGNISLLVETQGRLQYAYMMAAGKTGTGINSGKVSVKLHLESDDPAVVPVSDKLTLDGVKNKSGSDILESSVLFTSAGEFKPQLVMVRINDDGELKELDLATDNTGSAFGFDLKNFSLDYTSTSALSPRQINSLRTQNGNQIIDSNTVIFSVQNKATALETEEKDSVRVLSWSDYRKRYGSAYIKMYDADESWSTGAIVISEPLDISGERFFVVTEAYMQKDADGEYKQAINGWWTDDFRSFLEAEDGILSAAIKKRYPDSDGKIKPGDIFEIGFSIDEKINQARMLYSPLRDTEPDYTYFDMNGNDEINDDDNYYILGYPCYVSADRLSTFSKANAAYIRPSGSSSATTDTYATTILPSTSTTAFMVFEFDCMTKEVKVITRDAIPQGAQLTDTGYDNFNPDTKVFLKRIDGSVKDIMVVTNMSANYD